MPAEDVSEARYGLVKARLAIVLAVLPFPLTLLFLVIGAPSGMASFLQVVLDKSRLVFPGLAAVSRAVAESAYDGSHLFSFLTAISIWCLIASLIAACWSHFSGARQPVVMRQGIRVLMNGGQYRRPIFWAIFLGVWGYALYSIFWSGGFFLEALRTCTHYATSYAASTTSGHSKDCVSWGAASPTTALWQLGWQAAFGNFFLLLWTSIAWHELTSDQAAAPGAPDQG